MPDISRICVCTPKPSLCCRPRHQSPNRHHHLEVPWHCCQRESGTQSDCPPTPSASAPWGHPVTHAPASSVALCGTTINLSNLSSLVIHYYCREKGKKNVLEDRTWILKLEDRSIPQVLCPCVTFLGSLVTWKGTPIPVLL